jgi:hypothetical protein
MTEDTAFWGVTVEGYDRSGRPLSTLLVWKGTAPDSGPFRFYLVFDSKERAAEFVRNSFPHEHPKFVNGLVENNIRQIERNDIPDDHLVSLGGKDVVTWEELLAEGEWFSGAF